MDIREKDSLMRKALRLQVKARVCMSVIVPST